MGMSVDGVHYLHEEPRPFTTKSSSHKFGGVAGVGYEICVATNKAKITWLNGPFCAGHNDRKVFCEFGLKDAIEQKLQRRRNPDIRVIADDGYFAAEFCQTLSFWNEFDPRDLAYFKDRSLARHERVNGQSKDFHVLHRKFQHDRGMNQDGIFTRHKACTEAVFVTLHTI